MRHNSLFQRPLLAKFRYRSLQSQYSSSEQIGEMLDQTRISGPVRQNSSRFDSNDSYDDMASHQQAAAQNAFLNRPRSRSLTYVTGK